MFCCSSSSWSWLDCTDKKKNIDAVENKKNKILQQRNLLQDGYLPIFYFNAVNKLGRKNNHYLSTVFLLQQPFYPSGLSCKSLDKFYTPTVTSRLEP